MKQKVFAYTIDAVANKIILETAITLDQLISILDETQFGTLNAGAVIWSPVNKSLVTLVDENDEPVTEGTILQVAASFHLGANDSLYIQVDKPSSAGEGASNPSKDAFESRQRLQQYLTSIEYDSLGYEEARARLIAQYGGACTCVWKDGKMGRNYDYNLNHAMDYLLRVKAHNGRAASIGLASVKQLTKDNCDTYSDEYKYLPFRALDGMNEHGLCAAILLLNTNVHSANGSTPSIEERETVSAAMLDRYILDSFKTATEAVESIANYVRVKPIRYEQGGETVQKDVHFMVADKNDCYALEFIGTEVVATHLGGDGELPAIVANFLVDNLTLSNGEIGFDNLEDYAQGVERYQIAQEYLQGEGELLPLMAGLLTYTHLYTDSENKWLTDCSGDGVTYKDTDELLERWQDFHDAYDPDDKEAMREDGSFWQTVHSVAYDTASKMMQFVTQESSLETMTDIDCFPSVKGGGGEGIVMMTDDEYQPALEDLESHLI